MSRAGAEVTRYALDTARAARAWMLYSWASVLSVYDLPRVRQFMLDHAEHAYMICSTTTLR